MTQVNKQKLKVSLVVSDLSARGAGRWGGAVRQFLLAQALRQLDWEVELLGVAFGEAAPQVADSELPIVSFSCQHYGGFWRGARKVIVAMAKPILATPVGDIPRILGDTGYLVEPNSPQQLAHSIEFIIDNLDRANLKGVAARNRCVQQYSIDSMVKVLQEVIF